MADEFDWQGTLQLAVDVSFRLSLPPAARGAARPWRGGAGGARRKPLLRPGSSCSASRTRPLAQTGSCYAAMAFDTEGTFYGSYPLDAEGNYKHNV